MTMQSEARWQRLADAITAAGIPCKVTARAYSQTEYGRVVHGVSRSIVIGTGVGSITIRDKYGRMGKWYGYVADQARADGCDQDLIRRGATKRSEVVAAVRAAYLPSMEAPVNTLIEALVKFWLDFAHALTRRSIA